MKTGLNGAIIALGLVIVASVVLRSVPALAEEGPSHPPAVTAALMFTGGESAKCLFGNIADAYVVTVSVFDNSDNTTNSKYISGSGGCVVLPIALKTGTKINVTGVLQDTDAIPGGKPAEDTSSISENCFNVEGFSVGLATNNGSEFDPFDPANIINRQGFGFFWYDSDNDLKPGPYSYTVVGCSEPGCSTATKYYNTDSPSSSGS